VGAGVLSLGVKWLELEEVDSPLPSVPLLHLYR